MPIKNIMIYYGFFSSKAFIHVKHFLIINHIILEIILHACYSQKRVIYADLTTASGKNIILNLGYINSVYTKWEKFQTNII